MVWQRLSTLFVFVSISLLGNDFAKATETPLSKSKTTPTPDVISTSAADLLGQPAKLASKKNSLTNSNLQFAQTNIDPGRLTRGVSSYIGIAGNIGLGGDSTLSDTNFAVISKIGLTNTFSARPSVVIGDDPVVLLPLTYDFNPGSAEAFEDTFAIVPYAGAGVAIETSDDADIGLLLTGGIDVPLNTNLTANAAINAAFLSQTDVGLIIGVGYNFNGL
jgi:hypothetical protein